MVRTARILGFAAISLAAFGTAAGIASIGSAPQTMERYTAVSTRLPVEPARVAAVPGTRCDVVLAIGEMTGARDTVVTPLALSVRAEDSMDLDLPGSAGFSVACASGPTMTADAPVVRVSEARLSKADLVAR